MSRVLILVEGQTEGIFVERVLTPYLADRNIFLSKPIIIPTKKIVDRPHIKGGVTNYRQVKNALQRLLGDSSASAITTMIDFYGLPRDFPGYDEKSGNCFTQAGNLEEAFKNDINDRRFIPYFSLHEFEALLFVSPEIIASRFRESHCLDELRSIKSMFTSPEEINDSPDTAPSKRLIALYSTYSKVVDGIVIAEQIPIEEIRKECSHFNQWLEKLLSLGN